MLTQSDFYCAYIEGFLYRESTVGAILTRLTRSSINIRPRPVSFLPVLCEFPFQLINAQDTPSKFPIGIYQARLLGWINAMWALCFWIQEHPPWIPEIKLPTKLPTILLAKNVGGGWGGKGKVRWGSASPGYYYRYLAQLIYGPSVLG